VWLHHPNLAWCKGLCYLSGKYNYCYVCLDVWILKCVWNERNNRRFHSKSQHSLAVLSKINHFVEYWLGNISAKVKVTLEHVCWPKFCSFHGVCCFCIQLLGEVETLLLPYKVCTMVLYLTKKQALLVFCLNKGCGQLGTTLLRKMVVRLNWYYTGWQNPVRAFEFEALFFIPLKKKWKLP